MQKRREARGTRHTGCANSGTSRLSPGSPQDANQNTTTYAYDVRGRLATITYPIVPPATQPTTTVNTYDGMGRLQTATDQAGKITTKTYDAIGRLSTVKDAILPTANVTQYFYDPNSNLRFLQDAAGRVTSYQYDPLNHRASRTLPLNQSEYYTYDAVGNLYTHTDFKGKVTTYGYDTLNRLLSKTPDPRLNEHTVSFTYTPTGQRLSMTDASGTTNYPLYDNRDRLKTKATPEGTLNYTYDAHSNLLTLVSSKTNGASLAYTYDVLNRLSKVCDNRIAPNCGAVGTTTYGYDAVGNPSGYAYPNTVQTANVFDTQNRLTQTCQATSSPACSASQKLASYAYTLGNAGNRTNVAELSGRSLVYGYDNDYRLMSETIISDPGGNNGAENYTYDAVGNRQTLTSTIPSLPGSMSYSYDANDRLSTDSYDNDGNTISSGGTSNTYDFENRMTAHGSLSLTYDGDGNRVSETVGGTTTKFLVDDLNPTGLPQVLDEIVNGSVTRTYAYGGQRLSQNQLINGTWTPSFYGYDGHGSIRFLSNTAVSVTDFYDYDAFGMLIRTSGTTPNAFLYSGERSDSSIGLYDMRARYYNQATGRFWARDPVEGSRSLPVTSNPYLYAWDEPVDRADPTGLFAAVETVELDKYAVARGLAATVILAGLICEYYAEGSGVNAVTQPNVLGGVQTVYRAGPCEIRSKRKTCENSFPNMARCDSLPPDYTCNDLAQANSLVSAYWGRPVGPKPGQPTAAIKGPCSITSGKIAGTHYSLMFLDNPKQRNPYAGSIGCCPCCSDNGLQPTPEQRCAVLDVDHKPFP